MGRAIKELSNSTISVSTFTYTFPLLSPKLWCKSLIRIMMNVYTNSEGEPMIKAIIFDMDGVITETSEQHFEAWKMLGNMLGIDIDRAFNEQLKGVSRLESMRRILSFGGMDGVYSEEEIDKLTFVKNECYKKLISNFTPENVIPGAFELFRSLRERGIKIAIGSASRNAPTLIESMQLGEYIDYIVNPAEIQHGKPAPDIFLKAASELGVKVENCIGVEDAIAGVEAIKAAGMFAIGVGKKDVLESADIIVDSIDQLNHLRLW